MSGIVLAIRLGPESMAPTAVARELAEQTGGRITVAYVITGLEAVQLAAGQAGMDPAEERQRLLDGATAEVDAFMAEHLAGVPAAGRVLVGKVEDCVTDVARETAARFIVVGTRGRGALARLVLGDTVQAILQRTPCPVIVVPLGESPA
jgi:nucleotide-binding universal stress UspA family protein